MTNANENKSLFSLHGWSVIQNEDEDVITFDVLDDDGDLADAADTLPEAIDLCIDLATDAYRDRLIQAIEESDLSDFETHTLQAIAEMLGHTAKNI